MRISQYKCVMNLIDSVIEATEYMKAHDSEELCALCAQSLHSVLSTIESEDNCTKLVSMIRNAKECYDNNIYDSDDLLDLVKSIPQKASEILKCKLRVLFVAELGSKWDSMASVYKAFSEREDCIVDVVLEPIFREVQYDDGSINREVIYTDWLTPLGINHILYDQYDMNRIRPDITFFSQPYESCTIPMFWPENMCRYTKLVYLPYYSLFQVKKDDHVTYDILFKSLTEKYSWKIICQSEILKKYYEEYASNKGENVISCGLPKWDYPCALTKENTPCPEEWKDKIEGKKVFLWNTHFTVENSNLLEDFDKFVNEFENNNNIALIWRPHPMMQTIVKLYYPDKYEKYLRMISRVEKSSNMIMDTNSDYGYAFVWSDAMITDYSSLLLQYVFMNKPILLVVYLSEITCEEYAETIRDNNEFFDCTKLPMTNSAQKLGYFINEVATDNNIWKKDLDDLRKKYYSSADGSIGKRLSEIIIKDYLSEKGD